MKVRDGFVSNSSSSSFVVALDRHPHELSLELVMQIFDVGPEKGAILLRDLTDGLITAVPSSICQTCGHDRNSDNWDYDAEEVSETAKFVAQHPSAYIYSLAYSDEDGSLMSELEHGDHWQRVPHLHFSHH